MITLEQIDQQGHTNCVLCERKLKEGSEVPVGSVCRKKIQNKYRVAALNITPGCSEVCELSWDKERLKGYFGNSVDLYLLHNWGWGNITWVLPGDDSTFTTNMYGESDMMDDEEMDVTGNLAYAVSIFVRKQLVETELVHADTEALTWVQHSEYVGPAKSAEEIVKYWGVEELGPGCMCGRASMCIEEKEAELLDKIEVFGENPLPLYEKIVELAKEHLASVENTWMDIRNFPDFEKDFDYPITGSVMNHI